jgi:hypothetical protein
VLPHRLAPRARESRLPRSWDLDRVRRGRLRDLALAPRSPTARRRSEQ